jgi:hypothetical protein
LHYFVEEMTKAGLEAGAERGKEIAPSVLLTRYGTLLRGPRWQLHRRSVNTSETILRQHCKRKL